MASGLTRSVCDVRCQKRKFLVMQIAHVARRDVLVDWSVGVARCRGGPSRESEPGSTPVRARLAPCQPSSLYMAQLADGLASPLVSGLEQVET